MMTTSFAFLAFPWYAFVRSSGEAWYVKYRHVTVRDRGRRQPHIVSLVKPSELALLDYVAHDLRILMGE